jgi:hypothetical protein
MSLQKVRVGHVDLVGGPAMDSHSLPEMSPWMRAR